MSSPKQNNATPKHATRTKRALTVREMSVFAMLGALMYCSKLLLEWAPNIHLLALFIITFTRIYRVKALIPLYIFVFLTGLFGGFGLWWLAYLYVWLPLWGVTMLLPRRMPNGVAVPVFMALGGLHGLLFGVLYAPAQALFFGLDFKALVAWVAAGSPFDIAHAIGNLAACTLVVPLSRVVARLEGKRC